MRRRVPASAIPARREFLQILSSIAALAALVFVARFGLPQSDATPAVATESAQPCTWARVGQPVTSLATLFGVDGMGADDIWAVGNRPTGSNSASVLVEHWDGSTWSVVPAPDLDPSGGNSLSAVDAHSASDAWAVGLLSLPNNMYEPIAEHWDGISWSLVPVPYGPEQTVLNDVSVVAPDDAWAVGRVGGEPAVFHWDGLSWTRVPTPVPSSISELWAIHMISSNDGWATGSYVTDQPQLAEVPWMLHWDGTTWSTVDAPYISNSNGVIGVGASGSSDVWAVGQRRDLFTANVPLNTLVEHWDGSEWSTFEPPDPGFWHALTDVAAVSQDTAWAVGSFNTGSGPGLPISPALVFRWDGSAWTRDQLPLTGYFQSEAFEGVYAPAENDVWAVGSREGQSTGSPLIEHCSIDPDLDGIDNASDNCPNWYNPAQTLPDWPVRAGDTDCDGFPDDVPVAGRASEVAIGTDPLLPCAATATPYDEMSAMPPDFNDDQLINGQDSGKFGGPTGAYNHLVSQGPFSGVPGERFDFNGDGAINGQDTGKFSAYYNKTCA